jgi:hypothetical protein
MVDKIFSDSFNIEENYLKSDEANYTFGCYKKQEDATPQCELT